MTKRTFFLTLREDLLSILSLVERRGPLAYRRSGAYDSPAIPAFASAAELPALGFATSDCRTDEATYLVMPADLELKLYVIDRPRRRRLYIMNQNDNPDSVFLVPAGLHPSGPIVCGECVTGSKSRGSTRLYDAVRRALRSRCMRVGDCTYIGPLAHKAAVGGARLVDSVHEPLSADLTVAKRWRASRA
jgi:hypothetical protein